jgi:hypothetical protein
VFSLARKAPPRLQEVLRECDNRCVVFDNLNNPPQQVEDLLKLVRDLKRRNGRPYQCPEYALIGESMEEEIQRRLERVSKARESAAWRN